MISCRNPSFINGAVLIILTVRVNATAPNGTVTLSAAIFSETGDPVSGQQCGDSNDDRDGRRNDADADPDADADADPDADADIDEVSGAQSA